MWNLEPRTPTLSLFLTCPILCCCLFSSASAVPSKGYVHLTVSPPAGLSYLRYLLSCQCPDTEPLLPAPRLPGRRFIAHFHFRSVPLGLRGLCAVLRLFCQHPRNMAAAAARVWWRGLVGAASVARGEQGTAESTGSGRGAPGTETSRVSPAPLCLFLSVQGLSDPRCCCSG